MPILGVREALQWASNLFRGISNTLGRRLYPSLHIICQRVFCIPSVACPVGTSYDEKSFKCVLCDKGSYQDKEGKASCIECDEGKTTDSSGAASSEGCVEG